MPAPIFDEMNSAPGVVREHYAAYARWLAAQPVEVMRSRREEAELIFRAWASPSRCMAPRTRTARAPSA
jgi:uncharacterized circularly permuted ATP-grasp superfamily protein